MNNEELLLDLSLDDEQGIENASSSESKSNKYKDRKVEHKLTKYESIIKNVEKINRVDESEVRKQQENSTIKLI